MPDPQFLAGQTISASQLQRLGDEDTYTPTLIGDTVSPVLGVDPVQDALIWLNGNNVQIWFTIQFGTGATFGSGDYSMPLPAAYPPRLGLFNTTIGTARLVDVSSPGVEGELVAVLDAVNGSVRFQGIAGKFDTDSPFVLGDGDTLLGHISYITDFGASGALFGGPGEPTAPESPATPAPTVPFFDSDNATVVGAGQSLADAVAAGAEGDHFFVEDGAVIINVLVKANMHIRLAGDKTAFGSGQDYAFRPLNGNASGVAIGSDPSANRKAKIRDYGNGTQNQRYAAIMGVTDDVLAADFTREDVEDWFIYGLDLESNSAGGIYMGSNWTVYDCEIHGHEVTGIGGDRIVGGLVHSCDLYFNGLTGAGGSLANAANIKMTFVNADTGRTTNTPVNRPKAPLIISSSRIEGLDRGSGTGQTRRGIWFDLDCQDTLVEFCDIDDHEFFGYQAEGSNNCRIEDSTLRRTDGFGPAFGTDFRAAALFFSESTNCAARRNILVDCDVALMNRLSGRTDWTDPANEGSGTNFADPTGSRFYILDSTTIPAVDGQSNYWTGDNTFEENILVGCGSVMISEGVDNGFQPAIQGGTALSSIVFTGNNYDGSPGIEFFEASNTALDLAAWQALGRQ